MSANKGSRVRCDLRLPKYLHGRLVQAAEAAGVDLNTYINRCLADAVRNKEHRV